MISRILNDRRVQSFGAKFIPSFRARPYKEHSGNKTSLRREGMRGLDTGLQIPEQLEERRWLQVLFIFFSPKLTRELEIMECQTIQARRCGIQFGRIFSSHTDSSADVKTVLAKYLERTHIIKSLENPIQRSFVVSAVNTQHVDKTYY